MLTDLNDRIAMRLPDAKNHETDFKRAVKDGVHRSPESIRFKTIKRVGGDAEDKRKNYSVPKYMNRFDLPKKKPSRPLKIPSPPVNYEKLEQLRKQKELVRRFSIRDTMLEKEDRQKYRNWGRSQIDKPVA